MDIRIITDYDGLLELEDGWKRAFQNSESANIFISWEWSSLWVRHYLKGQELLVVVASENEEIIGIAPMVISKGNARALWKPVIRFIGGDLTDYMDFLVLRDNRQVVKAFIDQILKRAEWGMIEFMRIPESSPNFAPVMECLDVLKYKSLTRVSCLNPFIKIEGEWDDYCKSIKKGLKWLKVRLALKRFGSLEGVEFIKFDDNNSERLLDAYFKLHIKRQAYKMGRSLFEADINREFFTDAALVFSENGWADISAVTLDDRVISVVYAFSYNGIFYYWNPAFDPEFIKYAPGKVHLYNLIKNCFEEGYSKFDFMRGDEEYKFKWSGNVADSNYEIKVFKNDMLLKVDSLADRSRGYIKTAYNKYPLFKRLLIKISKYI